MRLSRVHLKCVCVLVCLCCMRAGASCSSGEKSGWAHLLWTNSAVTHIYPTAEAPVFFRIHPVALLCTRQLELHCPSESPLVPRMYLAADPVSLSRIRTLVTLYITLMCISGVCVCVCVALSWRFMCSRRKSGWAHLLWTNAAVTHIFPTAGAPVPFRIHPVPSLCIPDCWSSSSARNIPATHIRTWLQIQYPSVEPLHFAAFV